MELFSAFLYIVICGLYLRVIVKSVLFAGHIDFDKILINSASCTEIHMSDLRVAHLPVRKPDIFTAGLEMRKRIFGAERIDKGLSLSVNCI